MVISLAVEVEEPQTNRDKGQGKAIEQEPVICSIL